MSVQEQLAVSKSLAGRLPAPGPVPFRSWPQRRNSTA